MSEINPGVESVQLTAVHLRLGMAAVGWGIKELASQSGVSRATIRRALRGGGMRPATTRMLMMIFTAHKVAFLEADEGGGPGVRLMGK